MDTFTRVLLALVILQVWLLSVLVVTGDYAHGKSEPCVTSYAQVAPGMTLRRVTHTLGVPVERRSWRRGQNRYHQRVYALCTRTPRDHDTLTVRFQHHRRAWRAFLVDTHIGPERATKED